MLIKYAKIDEASRVLEDPLLLTTMLLRLPTLKSLRKRGSPREVLKQLSEFSRTALENRAAVFTKIDFENQVFRLVVLGELVVAIIGEGEEFVSGSKAFSQLASLAKEASRCSVWASAARIEDFPDEIKTYLSRALVERIGNPPDVWVGKKIYGIEVKSIVSSRGRFVYVLYGEDVLGNKYAVKIPREELVLEKDMSVVELFKGYLNSLVVTTASLSEVENSLEEQGHQAKNARSLLYYQKYITRPKIVVMPSDHYSSLVQYINAPPLVAEEYHDQGDLAGVLKSKKKLGLSLAVYLLSRIIGALALSHSLNVVHADLKPANILLYRCSEHQAIGYCPSIDDYAPIPRVTSKKSSVPAGVATPVYADPVSLILGEAGKKSDVYSFGMTAFHAITGTIIAPRLVLNSLVLSYFYGVKSSVRQVASKSRELEALAAKLEPILLGIKESKNPGEKLSEALGLVAEVEARYYELLRASTPYPIYKAIKAMTSLSYGDRPRDAVEAWNSFFKAVSESGLAQMLPPHGLPQ